jgi:hypothetical protein
MLPREGLDLVTQMAWGCPVGLVSGTRAGLDVLFRLLLEIIGSCSLRFSVRGGMFQHRAALYFQSATICINSTKPTANEG